MRSATQRIIDVLIDDNDYKETELCVLLHYLEHLQRTKRATFPQMHSALVMIYMNIPDAQKDAINTHLSGEPQ